MNFPNIWLHKPNNIKKFEIHHEGAVVQQPHAHQKNPHPTPQKHLCQTPVFSSCLLISFQSWSGCNGHLPNRISRPTPSAQAGPPTAGCPEQWADGLWVSPKGENPQFPWAICVKALTVSWCSEGTACGSSCSHCLSPSILQPKLSEPMAITFSSKFQLFWLLLRQYEDARK